MIEIIKPDGNKAKNPVSYSTSLQSIYIKGVVSQEITDMEIQFGGAKFTTTDVLLDGGNFTFPNPNVYSEGIDLSSGLNTFIISSFKTSGGVTTSLGSLTLNVIFSSEVADISTPPSGLRVSRLSDSIELSFTHSDNDVVYYNIYASNISSGVLKDYFKINFEPLTPSKYGQREELLEEIKQINTDLNMESVDPLFLEITATQKDSSDKSLIANVLSSFEVPDNVARVRFSSNVQSVSLDTRVVFKHARNADTTSVPPTNLVGVLNATPTTSPLYYVVTSVKVVDEIEIESPISSEISGMPIQVSTSNLSLPVVGRDQMATEMIKSIFLTQPDLSVQAGSVIRDVIIDPFLSEMERVRFLLDFCYRSSSFSGLLGIDDPLNEGESISVADSQYKTVLASALFVNEGTVQNFLDSAFEKLASNFGVQRSIGKQATGEVEFYTLTAPTTSISIPSGTVVSSGSIQFTTTLLATMSIDQLNTYYNPTTKKYSITVPIQASEGGSSANLTTNQINQGAPFGLKVTNSSPTFGGTDTETNSELASRAIGKLSSVDVSTKAGLERISREISGVVNSFIIDSESPFMQRDNGLGGKVDIWVRGESLATISETHAPSYQSFFGGKFIPVSSPTAYKFRSLDATVSTPISEMIDRSDLSLGLKNLSSNKTYDLTGVTIEDYRTIVLDNTISQPTYNTTDIILGDWRSNITDKIILKRQPVREISSIVYADATAITGYTFKNSEDPLQLGRSSKASDYILIPNDTTRNKIISSTDEEHIIVGYYPERLNFLGADQLSVVVKDQAKSTTYKSPFLFSSPDYTISKDSDNLFYIQRTKDSAIKDGETLFISYNYSENITVSYKTNLVISNTQSSVDLNKNLMADIAVKEAISCLVDIKATVILDKGVSLPLIDSEIRFNLINFINELSLGGSIRHSEVVSVINNVVGVNHVILPLTQMSFASDTFILRESISLAVGGYNHISSLSNSKVNVWAIDSQLLNKTQELGGDRGRVFIEQEEMTILGTVERLNSSLWEHKTATIVGNQGLNIVGVETSNRVLLALNVGDDPSKYTFYVDYNVEGTIETVSELKLDNFSFFKTGDLNFTYEEVQ